MGQSRRSQTGERLGQGRVEGGGRYLVLLSHVQAEPLVAAGDTENAINLVHQSG
jgi:hypothetical protein